MLQSSTLALRVQLLELRRRNIGLAVLMDCLAERVWNRDRKNVVVCGVFRTMHEQRTVYSRGTKKVNPRLALHAVDLKEWVGDRSDIEARLAYLRNSATPHMFWHAVDVRDWTYTPDEIEAILAFLRRYDAYNQLPAIHAARSKTVWLHRAGTREPHLHIQYKGPAVVLSDRRAAAA